MLIFLMTFLNAQWILGFKSWGLMSWEVRCRYVLKIFSSGKKEKRRSWSLFRNMRCATDSRRVKALTAAVWMEPDSASLPSASLPLWKSFAHFFYLYSIQISAGRLVLSLCLKTGHQLGLSRNIQPFLPNVCVESRVTSFLAPSSVECRH